MIPAVINSNGTISIVKPDGTFIMIEENHPQHSVIIEKIKNPKCEYIDIESLIDNKKFIKKFIMEQNAKYENAKAGSSESSVKTVTKTTSKTIDSADDGFLVDPSKINIVSEHSLSKKNSLIIANRTDGDKEEIVVLKIDKTYEILSKATIDLVANLIKNKRGFRAIINFYKNVAKNPKAYIRRELLGFLGADEYSFTEDGCFIAYKSVKANYMSHFSGKDGHVDFTPGKEQRLDPKHVDFDRRNTCSTGLHFANRNYAWGFYDTGSIKIAVKINPAEVAAFPTDYRNQKGRAVATFSLGKINKNHELKKGLVTNKEIEKLTFTEVKQEEGKAVKSKEDDAPLMKKSTSKEKTYLYLTTEQKSLSEHKWTYQKNNYRGFILGLVKASTSAKDTFDELTKINPEIAIIAKYYSYSKELKKDIASVDRMLLFDITIKKDNKFRASLKAVPLNILGIKNEQKPVSVKEENFSEPKPKKSVTNGKSEDFYVEWNYQRKKFSGYDLAMVPAKCYVVDIINTTKSTPIFEEIVGDHPYKVCIVKKIASVARKLIITTHKNGVVLKKFEIKAVPLALLKS